MATGMIPSPKNRRPHGTRATALAAATVFALRSIGLPAATLDLAGPGASFDPAGLDADAVVREVPWALVNPAESDSLYAALPPDWSAWQAVPDGRLLVRATVECGPSNAVWLAFGPEDAPALRIGREAGRWHVLGGDGALPADPCEGPGPEPAPSGTFSVAIALRTGPTLAEGSTETLVREGAGPWQRVPELDLARLGWTADAQRPSLWDTVRLSLRGTGAAISELALSFEEDATVVLVR